MISKKHFLLRWINSWRSWLDQHNSFASLAFWVSTVCLQHIYEIIWAPFILFIYKYTEDPNWFQVSIIVLFLTSHEFVFIHLFFSLYVYYFLIFLLNLTYCIPIMTWERYILGSKEIIYKYISTHIHMSELRIVKDYEI